MFLKAEYRVSPITLLGLRDSDVDFRIQSSPDVPANLGRTPAPRGLIKLESKISSPERLDPRLGFHSLRWVLEPAVFFSWSPSGSDSSKVHQEKGAPAYLVIALIQIYSTLFLMAPRHLDRSKLMGLDLHYIMTD